MHSYKVVCIGAVNNGHKIWHVVTCIAYKVVCIGAVNNGYKIWHVVTCIATRWSA